MYIQKDMSVTSLGLGESVTTLIAGIRELGSRSSMPKCETYLKNLQTLREVLQHAHKECELALSPFNHGDLPNTNNPLPQCLQDCDSTCRDYDAILTKILRSKIRKFAWRFYQSDLIDVAARLESNKSTLQICLSTITQQRLRIQDQTSAGGSWISQLKADWEKFPTDTTSGSWDHVLPLDEKAPPYPDDEKPSPQLPEENEHIHHDDPKKPDTDRLDEDIPSNPNKETNKPDNNSKTHIHPQKTTTHNPATCVVCRCEKSDKEIQEARKRHENGQCAEYAYCVVCACEKSDKEIQKARKRHENGQCAESAYCVVCACERTDREIAEVRRIHAESLRGGMS